ncbi:MULTISPECIES: alpha/beta fold hydrolase [Streptomyces]|uniref:alpha/beta fold hydrolase n=1 Tax=Streptomyces TaxID=1883 RepID=UPI000B8618C4|nr:alpha/beta fold hydrolase [Streptomyces sp. SID4950]
MSPLLPLCRKLLPDRPAALSPTLLKATALELAILIGHLALYPSGITPERHRDQDPAPLPSDGGNGRYGGHGGQDGHGEYGGSGGHGKYGAETTPGPTGTPGTPRPTGTPGTLGAPGAHGTPGTPDADSASGTSDALDAPDPDAPDAPRALRLPVPAGTPVVLLHGFIDNRSVFVLLRRSLARHGRRQLTSLNYSPLTCDIRTAAELLGRHIEEICARTGSPRVDVVGHSLGGLIARYYAQRLGGDRRVRTLVTLGTPHSGTRVAPLANAHPIVRQMRPGSDLLTELAAPAPGCRTRFVGFWSDLDHLMDPPETARVDHPDLLAWNVRVSGIGHLALPVHPAVAAGVRQALDLAESEAGSDARTDGLTVA